MSSEHCCTCTTESIIMDALSTLTPSQLSSLSASLSSTFHHHHHHLTSLLSCPTLFTHTLNHLSSLSLPQKSLLIARHLLSFLRLLTPYLLLQSPPSPALHTTSYSNRVRLRDLDSVLLLLFFCEVRQHQPALLEDAGSRADWLEILKDYSSNTMLKNLSAGFAVSLSLTPYQVLGAYVDLVVKCKRFAGSKGCGGGTEGGSNNRREVAASMEAVVALPSVMVEGGEECVICKEEMKEGRDVSELPCEHKFHWKCVLAWLSKRNTCPCCRFMLPTDDVYAEIQRLWDAIFKLATPQPA